MRKATVLSVGAAVLVVIACGVGFSQTKQPAQPPAVTMSRVIQNDVSSRFQLVHGPSLPQTQADLFLVDGLEGRIWIAGTVDGKVGFIELFVENNPQSVPYQREFDRQHNIKFRITR